MVLIIKTFVGCKAVEHFILDYMEDIGTLNNSGDNDKVVHARWNMGIDNDTLILTDSIQIFKRSFNITILCYFFFHPKE